MPKLVKRFRQSVLSAAVSGELTREWRGGGDAEWGDAILNSLVKEPIRNGRSVRDGDGPKVLRLSAFKRGELLWNESKNGEWEGLDHSKYIVLDDDFLISRGNGSLALVAHGALAKKSPGDIAFPDTMIRIRLDFLKLALQFLALIWQSAPVRSQIQSAVKTTAGIWKVSQGDLETISLPMPPPL